MFVSFVHNKPISFPDVRFRSFHKPLEWVGLFTSQTNKFENEKGNTALFAVF
jgi:hypothetical protein